MSDATETDAIQPIDERNRQERFRDRMAEAQGQVDEAKNLLSTGYGHNSTTSLHHLLVAISAQLAAFGELVSATLDEELVHAAEHDNGTA